MCNNGYTSVLFFVLVQLLCKSNSLPTHLVTSEAIWTIEVPYGENVMLECQSNDENHIFDFWVVENQQVVIGPSNVGYDIRKFKYEILTGNLTIRAISKRDQGFYTCYSKGIEKDDIKIHKVSLLVRQDFEEVYEHDRDINVIRILIVLIAFVLLLAGAYVVYRIWKDRYRYPSYLEQEDDDENSTDELFSAPTTSRVKSPNPIVIQSKSNNDNDFESVSTDFTSILDVSSNK